MDTMEPTSERPRRRGPQKPMPKPMTPPTAVKENDEEMLAHPATEMSDVEMKAATEENASSEKAQRPARDMRWMAQLRDRASGQDALFDFGTKGELNTFLRENPNLYIVGDRVIRGYFKTVKVQTQARF